jgi:hypothetical protein
MKVSELIEHLKECNQDAEVVLSVDKGISYHRIIEALHYIAKNITYKPLDGNYVLDTIYMKELTQAGIDNGFSEDAVLSVEDGGVECIVIYP